jgi:hypothetical protein
MPELFAFALLLAAAWFWWDSTRAREAAVLAATRACARASVQFLDGSVVLRRLRLARDRRGQLRLARLYTFDFSPDGSRRRPGYVVMLGDVVRDLYLDLDADEASDQSGKFSW